MIAKISSSFLHFITSVVSADLDSGSGLEDIIDADTPGNGISDGKIVYASADMMKLCRSRSFFNKFLPDKIIDKTNIIDGDIICGEEGSLETINVGNN